MPENVPVRAYQCPCRGVSRSRLFDFGQAELRKIALNKQADQKYMKLLMENPNTGIIKKAPVGVSWTTLFFPSLPALFRGDIKWFIIQLILAWTLICPIIFAFIYNKQYINALLERGFKVKDVEGGTLEDAKKQLSINLPQFEMKS